MDVPSTSDSPDATSNISNRPLLGDANEFHIAQEQWLARQARRRAAAAATESVVVVAAPPPPPPSPPPTAAAATDQSVEH